MEVTNGHPEENEQPSNASPDSPVVKVLVQAWREVNSVERRMLRDISLAELLERAKGQDQRMYYI